MHSGIGCDGFVFGQSEAVVNFSGRPVAVFSALPEFALVEAGEHRAVFLGLVFEDGHAFAMELVGGKGDGHFDFFRLPFLPGAAIEPDFAGLHPIAIRQSLERFEDGGETHPMRPVRVGEIAGGVNLVRLGLLQQLHHDLDVGFTERRLAHPAGLVEREVEEVDVLMDLEARREMETQTGGARSVPQIFIGDTHVGGCDELYELEREGKLDPLLA